VNDWGKRYIFLGQMTRMVSLAVAVTGTVVATFGWLAFIVLDFWQKAAIFIASGAIVFGAIVALWASWALRHSGH
jgi:hypothetical protein